MKVMKARNVQIEPGDIRQEYHTAVETSQGLYFLTSMLTSGKARLEPDLVGWPPYNATLHLPDGYSFHVLVVEED